MFFSPQVVIEIIIKYGKNNRFKNIDSIIKVRKLFGAIFCQKYTINIDIYDIKYLPFPC